MAWKGLIHSKTKQPTNQPTNKYKQLVLYLVDYQAMKITVTIPYQFLQSC